jgi:paraquat-inducible protein A
MTIACPDCGTIQDLPPLPSGAIAICRGCDDRLERTAGRSIDAALACAASTLVLLFPANLLPFLGARIAGTSIETRLGSGVAVLWQQGWPLLALLIGAFAVLLPFLHFGLLTLTLAMLRVGRRPAWLGAAFRWAILLMQWAMPDVFLIACAIGYSRVAVYVPVQILPGGWCFLAMAFLSMITHAALDRRSVWRAIAAERRLPHGQSAISCTVCDLLLPSSAEGGSCPRCRKRVFARKPDALIRTAALVVAGYLLYAPSMIYPMTTLIVFGEVQGTTIYSGIEQLIHAHLWILAVVIFAASIAIPLLKLAGLSWFLLSVVRRSRGALVARTKLHRFIDHIGRWSCIDPFTLVVFSPLMRVGNVVVAHAGNAALPFLTVVIVTMAASRFFDPRLMWDAAEAPL